VVGGKPLWQWICGAGEWKNMSEKCVGRAQAYTGELSGRLHWRVNLWKRKKVGRAHIRDRNDGFAQYSIPEGEGIARKKLS